MSKKKKTKVVKPMNVSIPNYHQNLNYKVEEEIKPIVIRPKEIFEMMNAKVSLPKKSKSKPKSAYIKKV